VGDKSVGIAPKDIVTRANSTFETYQHQSSARKGWAGYVFFHALIEGESTAVYRPQRSCPSHHAILMNPDIIAFEDASSPAKERKVQLTSPRSHSASALLKFSQKP
jgi:hypothetical protein